jgi:hypothetical protein
MRDPLASSEIIPGREAKPTAPTVSRNIPSIVTRSGEIKRSISLLSPSSFPCFFRDEDDPTVFLCLDLECTMFLEMTANLHSQQ